MSDKPNIRMCRSRGGLIPLEDIDREQIDALAWNQPIEVTVKQKRSPENARHFWAVMQRLVSSGAVPFKTAESLVDAVKMECGVVEFRMRLDGTAYAVPGSISFAKADEAKFNAFKAEAFRVLGETYGLDMSTIADPRIRSAA